MLLARKLNATDNPNDAIFAFRRGTWLSPNNVRRQWCQARADTDLDTSARAHSGGRPPWHVAELDRVVREPAAAGVP